MNERGLCSERSLCSGTYREFWIHLRRYLIYLYRSIRSENDLVGDTIRQLYFIHFVIEYC